VKAVNIRPLWLILPVVTAAHVGLLWWARDILLFHYPPRDNTPFIVNFTTEEFPIESKPGQKGGLMEKQFTVSTSLIPASPWLNSPGTRLEDLLPLNPKINIDTTEARLQPPRIPPRISVFNLRAEGRRVVFLIDASGSMWRKQGSRTRFEIAQDEVNRSIAALPEDAQFNIVYFADRPVTFSDQPRYASARAKSEARDFLSTPPRLRGETNFVDGLGVAFQQQPDNLFILTDGIANQKSDEVVDGEKALRQRYARGSKVYAVGFGLSREGREADLLKKLTLPTNGEFEIQE
jgi:hypothetical protein